MKYLAEHIVALEIATIVIVLLVTWGIGVHFDNKMQMVQDDLVEQNARIVQTYDMTVANTRKDSTYYVESYLRQFEAEKEAVLRDIRKKDSILSSDSEYLKQRQKLWAMEAKLLRR